MDLSLEPPEAQALWRAAERGGMAASSLRGRPQVRRICLVRRAPPHHRGPLETRIVGNGETRPLADYRTPPDRSGPPVEPLPRPDAIRMRLDVEHPDKKGETLALDADLAFAGEAWAWLSDVRPLVTAGSDIEPAELADVLREAFFSPSDEADADSWETQRARFEEEATHLAIGLLCSEEEALRRTIAECGAARTVLAHPPRQRTVTITVRGGVGRRRLRRRGGRAMKKPWTVQCGYTAYFASTLIVEAETLEEALEKAVETARTDEDWRADRPLQQVFSWMPSARASMPIQAIRTRPGRSPTGSPRAASRRSSP